MISSKIENIQKRLNNNEAALISKPCNRFYLTGFNSSDGYVVITKNQAVFLVDFRYIEKAKEVVKFLDVKLMENSLNDISTLLKNNKINNLYLESEYVSLSEFFKYQQAFLNVNIDNSNKLDNIITSLRRIKTEDEITNIKKAQEITDKTFTYILNRIDINRTEKEIMLDMEFYLRGLGSEGVSFDFIVVSGKNSSLPHGEPTDKKINKGDFLTMDFGAVVNGYRSDMTRTVAIKSVTEEQKEIYNLVLNAQQKAIDSIKPGVICKDIDKIARDIIYNAGYKGCFGHGLGHSVGVEIHESPNFNTKCDTLLEKGMVMTVEPGIYLENRFGVRIEDMVYVTKNGCENLTKSNKELIIL